MPPFVSRAQPVLGLLLGVLTVAWILWWQYAVMRWQGSPLSHDTLLQVGAPLALLLALPGVSRRERLQRVAWAGIAGLIGGAALMFCGLIMTFGHGAHPSLVRMLALSGLGVAAVAGLMAAAPERLAGLGVGAGTCLAVMFFVLGQGIGLGDLCWVVAHLGLGFGAGELNLRTTTWSHVVDVPVFAVTDGGFEPIGGR